MENPSGLKVRFPDLVGYPLQSMVMVPPAESGINFPSTPYGTRPTSPSWTTFAVTLSGAWHILPWRLGYSWIYHKAKGDNKVESKLEVLVGLGVFVMFTLSLLHMLRFSNGFLTPPLWDLINFQIMLPFHIPILLSLIHIASKTSVNIFPSDEARQFDWSGLGHY